MDRNGNSFPAFRTFHLEMLSQGLTKNGFAVLRFDKRGTGKSVLHEEAKTDFSFDYYINDAKGWAAMLDADDRISSYAFMGHSQGSLIAMIAS